MLKKLLYLEKHKQTWNIFISDQKGSYIIYSTLILFVISIMSISSSFLYFQSEYYKINKDITKQRYAITAESGAEEFIHDIKVFLAKKEIKMEYDETINDYVINSEEKIISKEEILNIIKEHPKVISEIVLDKGQTIKYKYYINKETLSLWDETYIKETDEVNFLDHSMNTVGSFYINFEVIPIIESNENLQNLKTLKVNVGIGVKLKEIEFKEETYINENGETQIRLETYTTLDIL